MLILDANVLVSAVLGRSRSLLQTTTERGLILLMPLAQLKEARVVLGRFGSTPDQYEPLINEAISQVDSVAYEPFEAVARDRLGPRGQSDWPVLAAALALEADIWSNDRDFFGVGVAVWTTRNVGWAAG